MDTLLAFIDVIGLVCFTVAYHYSFKNYKIKKPSAEVAGIYCSSMGIGILLFVALSLIAFNFFVPLFELVFSHLLTFMIGLLTVLIIIRSY